MATIAQTLLNITRVAERAFEWIDAVRNRPSEAATAAKRLERALNPSGMDRRDNDKVTGRCAVIMPGDWPESMPAQFGSIRRLKDKLDAGADPAKVAAAMELDAAPLLDCCIRLYDGERLRPSFHRELEDAARTLRLSEINGETVRHTLVARG